MLKSVESNFKMFLLFNYIWFMIYICVLNGVFIADWKGKRDA